VRIRQVMLFSLFSSWTLMMVHSIVPHTHPGTYHVGTPSGLHHDVLTPDPDPDHKSHQHSTAIHQHESEAQHHDQGDSEKKGSTPNFIHAPDFGKVLLKPSFSPEDLIKEYNWQLICITAYLSSTISETSTQQNWFLQKPPPLLNHCPYFFSLRGPPSFDI